MLSNSLDMTSKSLINPQTKLKEDLLKTDELTNKLKYLLDSFINEKKYLIERNVLTIKKLNPKNYINTANNQVAALDKNLKVLTKNMVNIKNETFKGIVKELEALSPLEILARGYSITKIKSSQKIIRDSKNLKIGDVISSVVAKAEIESKITKID